jgi:hypothetical protein
MKQYSTWILLLAVCGLTIAAGAMQGVFTNRWGAKPDLAAAADLLKLIPTEFGDWETRSDQQFDNATVQMLQCAGHINRTYVNRQTGDAINVALLIGPPGPISVHTPEVCYPARDLEVFESPQRVETRPRDEKKDEFWRMVFRSKDLTADYMEVWYGWSPGSQNPWTAPTQPRLVYTASNAPILWKIQVATPLSPEASTVQNNPCRRFLEDFTPLVQSAFDQAGRPAESPDADSTAAAPAVSQRPSSVVAR